MADWQILCRQVPLLRLHSVVLALVPVIHLRIMHFQSDIQQGISLTEKVQSCSRVRFLQLHLWMPVLLLQQQLIRDSLQQLQIWMWNSQAQHIILIRQYMLTECSIVRVWQILTRKSSLALISRIGQRWLNFQRILLLRLFLRFMILLQQLMSLFHQERLHHTVLILWDLLNLPFQERILHM